MTGMIRNPIARTAVPARLCSPHPHAAAAGGMATHASQGGEDVEDESAAGVVMSRFSCSEVKPISRLRRSPP